MQVDVVEGARRLQDDAKEGANRCSTGAQEHKAGTTAADDDDVQVCVSLVSCLPRAHTWKQSPGVGAKGLKMEPRGLSCKEHSTVSCLRTNSTSGRG
jgi:hypothetical protein